MVELVELIQIALKEGAPLAISAMKDSQREKHVEKLEKIQNEAYERMLSKLKEEDDIAPLKEKSQALLERINKLRESCPSCQSKSLKETTGNRTWQLLHATASAYPLSPTEEDKRRVKQFIDSVVTNFPCAECAEHAKPGLQSLDYSSRASLERSLCRFHDEINVKIGKKPHGCS